MKTKTLLTFVVLFTTMMSWAITPKEVTWSMVGNRTSMGLSASAYGAVIWGDYNNDGNLDAFHIAGQNTPRVGLHKNNGDGTFALITTTIPPLKRASAVFLDYNNDGNLDLLVAGQDASGVIQTILYKNSGAPDYTFVKDEANTNSLVNVYLESDYSSRILEAFDYNNDGWTDILINGNHGASSWTETGSGRVVALYKNNKGTFELQTTPVTNTGNYHFHSVNGGSIHVGDVNNDGFDDIIVSGYLDGTGGVTNLYINQQDGTFLHHNPTTFTGHYQGETLFVDINGDGSNDIVEIGPGFANLFINNQENPITKIESSTSNLTGGQVRIAAGDVNNDGYTDLMAVGLNSNSNLFYNNGDNSFTVKSLPEAARARSGRIEMVDFNNDYSLDFSNFGYKAQDGTGNTEDWTHVYFKNTLGDGIPVNTPPTKPTNLAFTGGDGQYTVTWDKSTDDITPQDAIRYNLYIKYEDNSVFCLVPADTTTGKLKVSGLKSFLQTNSAKLNLPKGIYTIGIAAVDQAYASSAFATMVINDPATGLQSETLDNVRVHASNNAILITNNSENTLSCDILSLDGRLINSDIINANSNSSISIYNKGVYLVKLNGGRNARIDKVIVN